MAAERLSERERDIILLALLKASDEESRALLVRLSRPGAHLSVASEERDLRRRGVKAALRVAE